MGKHLHELVTPGNPLLITSPGSGVLSMAKEVAWKLGKEPRLVCADCAEKDAFEADFRSTSPGDVVILEDMHRASDEVRAVARELMFDTERLVIMALRGSPLPEFPPENFGHWAKF